MHTQARLVVSANKGYNQVGTEIEWDALQWLDYIMHD